MRGEFRNEPFLDFSKDENRQAMLAAIKNARASFGKEYALWIGGEDIKTKDTIKTLNPSNPSEVIGTFPKADEKIAEQAMQAALKAYETWSRTPVEKRAEYLFKAADELRKRRFESNAIMVLEVGKSWPEADGDTAEAIDFLEFYAREALRYGGEQPITPCPGEKPELRYIPLGVGVVIPPWNFPMAICLGMTTAAIVSGNTVIVKPSSDSPATAALFVDIMKSVGLPGGVLNFMTGSGRVAGEYLVKHPKTRFISFTGSKAVGLGIVKKAGETADGQIWIKRVVAEMGGKDAIVVDNEADLDAAAEGVALAAFGFQGQKCSACSRAIIVDSVYDKFVEKLMPHVEKMTVGDPSDGTSYMGPVVNEAAFKSIHDYMKVGAKDGKLLTGGGPTGQDGYFLQPTVIGDVDRNDRIAQEEIFGPVLALIRAKDFDDALAVANGTEYGLTGAVYTENREKVDKAKREFHVGNLYVNRKCTGALVGVHPFGGFNMSGTDSKAGGRDYLLLFQQAKSISEKI